MDLATLGLAIDSAPVARAAKDLDAISAAGAKAERSSNAFIAAQEKMLAAIGRLERLLASMDSKLAAISMSSGKAASAISGLSAANQNAARSAEDLATASTRGAAANDNSAKAAKRHADALRDMAEAERLAASVTDSQTRFNSLLGVGNGSDKSARESAAAFEDAARKAETFEQRVAALRVQVDPLGAAQAKLNAELAEYADMASRGAISSEELTKANALAKQRFQEAESGASSASSAFEQWRDRVVTLKNAIVALGAALAVGTVIRYADAWSDMQSRVGAAIRDMEAAPQMMQRLVDIANASYSPLDQTVEVYSRNVAVIREMGGSAKQAADFTEALNHALVITATRGERAAQVQSALSKAMAVGKLQADGLETVLANGGEVAQVLAKELGTTVNGLRKMATDGKITGSVIANSLINRLSELRDRAAEMPATVGDAFTRLRTNLTSFIGQLDQSMGSSERLAAAIMWVADNLGTLTRAATVAGVAILAAMGPAILSSIAVGFGYMAAAGVAAINAIIIATVRHPLGLIAVAISTTIVALYQFRDEIRAAIGDDLFNMVKGAANFLINSFKAAFEDLKFVFSNFPTIIEAAVFGAVNAIGSGIAAMINLAIDGINKLKTLVNSFTSMIGADRAAEWLGFSGQFSMTEQMANIPIRNRAAERLSAGMGGDVEPGTGRVSGHIGNIQRIMATDNFASSNQDIAISAESAEGAVNKLNNAIDAAGGKKSKAQKEAEKLARAYKKIVENARQFITQQELEARAVGMSEEAANRLRYEQEMLNKAANDNINLTAAQRAEIAGLAQQMSSAEAATNRLQEAYDFAKETTRGFVSDLRSGLEQGKGFWESFANAAQNAINKIIDKMLNNLIDAIFQVNSAASGGSGGGFLGSIFGGIGKILGFARGGFTGEGAETKPAGIVHAGEFVFSKKATDRLGVGYLNQLHNAAKGYMLGGYVTPRVFAPANANLRGYQTGGHVQPAPRFTGNAAIARETEVIEFVLRDDSGRMAEIADQRIQTASGPIIQVSVQQSTKAVKSQMPGMLADAQTRKM
jgi:lambda family phage tail tape measure protein